MSAEYLAGVIFAHLVFIAIVVLSRRTPTDRRRPTVYTDGHIIGVDDNEYARS